MLDQNPNIQVRAKACMALATMRKDAAEYGTNAIATAEAEKLYRRKIAITEKCNQPIVLTPAVIDVFFPA